MVDLDLIANQLRAYGHTVTSYFPVPANAGEYEFTVDGQVLSLEQTRALLAADEETGPPRPRL